MTRSVFWKSSIATTMLIFILTALGGFGCTSQSDITIPATIQATRIDTLTPTRTPTSRSTATATQTFTPSPTPSLTPTPSVEVTSTETCAKRENILQSGFLSAGKIVFRDSKGYSEPDQLYSLSSSEMEILPFMEDLEPGWFNYFHVSPDGNWLVFRQERLKDQNYIHELFLVTEDASRRKNVSWDETNWAGLKGWFADNQHLLITPKRASDTRRWDEIIIFNPFTGNQQRIMPSFSYPDDKFVYDNWKYVGSDVVYDPTLTRVIYLEDNETMVLWDLENEKELWRFVDPILMQSKVPTWSPDGNLLAFVEFVGNSYEFIGNDGQFHISLINRDGVQIWRSEPYPNYKQWFQSMVVHWSPNSRYLVFRWIVPSGEEQHTFILDTTTMEIIDYCINGSYPIWSPDSHQFILHEGPFLPEAPFDERDNYGNIVIDLKSSTIFQLDDIEFYPVAWYKTE